jgi:hypothetical protein
MQPTNTHDTKMTAPKTLATAPVKSGSGTHGSVATAKAISPHVKALVHASHKIEYSKDHPKAGVKTPSTPVLK